MIVCKADPAWKIIFQPAHALLAGKIYSKLSTRLKCHSPIETFLAISIHDDFPEEFKSHEKRYIAESGAPRDFTEMQMSEALRFDEAKLTIKTAKRKSIWIGLLRSYHAHRLYNDEDVSVPFRKFLDEEKSWRAKALRHLKLKKSDLENAYSVMEFCDRCSLILCKQELPAMSRKLEITRMLGKQYNIVEAPTKTITVSPWPFEENKFSVDIETRRVSQVSFADDKHLGVALERAQTESQIFNFERK